MCGVFIVLFKLYKVVMGVTFAFSHVGQSVYGGTHRVQSSATMIGYPYSVDLMMSG
jgi:hypothetical protein